GMRRMGAGERGKDPAGEGTARGRGRDRTLRRALAARGAKVTPAEKGFESNSLALQVHGGYGYSSEFLPEAWLRDQKLNSIHEGTTGIQGLDLLGRKAVAEAGAALLAFQEEAEAAARRAERAGVDPAWGAALVEAVGELTSLTAHLAGLGLSGDVEAMLLHSADYLDLFSVIAVAWQWILQAAAAKEGLAARPSDGDFYQGKILAAQYFLATELPRVKQLAALCRAGEDSYAKMRPEW